MDDGIYPGLTRAAYDSIDAINQSTLKKFKRSAAHARYAMLNPSPPSAEMALGTALHCAVLEPTFFDLRYTVAPKFNRRTKKGKADAEEFEGKVARLGMECIDAKEMDTVMAMRDSLLANPLTRTLLTSLGKNEVGVVWTDWEYKVKCKALVDRITTYDGITTVVDLKTTSNAAEGPFAASSAKYGYHMQAPFYLDGLEKAAGNAHRRFVFVVVESEPPYGVAAYRLHPDAISSGRAQIRRYLQMYAECRAIDVWPGYVEDIGFLTLPKWAMEEV